MTLLPISGVTTRRDLATLTCLCSSAVAWDFIATNPVHQKEMCGLEWSRVSIQRREVRLTKTRTSSPRGVPTSVPIAASHQF
jgi:hypothetical protein